MADPQLSPGALFARDFVVEGALGEGGMGAVYRVRQESTGKRRALKTMHPRLVADPALRRRFEQEARVGSQIESDHVVEVHAAGVDEATGRPYLVMELLDGSDLAKALASHGALALEEVTDLFEQLCHAMGAAHKAGIIHRDLKPENVFLSRSRRANSAAYVVKVLDFGIAKLALEASTRDSTGALGSPLWMAPEQTARGHVLPAADVWALGLIAFAALTGKPFWLAAEGGNLPQLLREIVLDPIPAASARATELAVTFPPFLDAWFARAVAREPERRFEDAGVLFSALREACREARPSLPSSTGFAATLFASAPPPRAVPPLLGRTTPLAVPGPSERPPAGKLAIPDATPMAVANRTLGTKPRERRAFGLMGIGVGALAIAAIVPIVGHLPRGKAPSTTAPASPAMPSAPALDPTLGPPPAAAPTDQAPSPASPFPLASAVAPASPTRPPPTPRAGRAPAAPAAAPSPTTDDSADEDPAATGRPTVMSVGNGSVRLLAKLVKNGSNVADGAVRKAVEWDAWQYLGCYKTFFAALSPRPGGQVVVKFDILDQLPQHAALVSSDFVDTAFSKCVVNTLAGQTINAAGATGAGPVVYAFRFIP